MRQKRCEGVKVLEHEQINWMLQNERTDEPPPRLMFPFSLDHSIKFHAENLLIPFLYDFSSAFPYTIDYSRI